MQECSAGQSTRVERDDDDRCRRWTVTPHSLREHHMRVDWHGGERQIRRAHNIDKSIAVHASPSLRPASNKDSGRRERESSTRKTWRRRAATKKGGSVGVPLLRCPANVTPSIVLSSSSRLGHRVIVCKNRSRRPFSRKGSVEASGRTSFCAPRPASRARAVFAIAWPHEASKRERWRHHCICLFRPANLGATCS